MQLGVYVHVPFCATRCTYCDFNTYTASELHGLRRDEFAATAIAELPLAAHVAGDPAGPVTTVFLGGGTPTLLAPADVGALLRAIDAGLGLAADAEVTVEANPDSVTPASLADLREHGVTRISLGMQSAREHVLGVLGRTHAAGRPPAAAREARAAGFEHVSLDLIYGTPGEADEDWRASLEAALAAEPDHLSAYGLTLAAGTRLHADVRRGRLPAPDDDVLANRYLAAEEALAADGFAWYEVSNWSRTPAARCRHNDGYWRGADWLAIGPGAHGHAAGRRWRNLRHPAAWAGSVRAGRAPVAGEETLDAEQRRLERVLLETRTAAGLDAGVLDAPGSAAAARLARDGLLEAAALRAQRVVLTLRGRLLADAVARALA